MMMNDFRFYHKDFLLDFIEVYKNCPSLWQLKNPDYHNKDKKNKDFEVLIKKMKEIEPRADRNSVTHKISNLRSVYKRECKRLSKLQPDRKPQELISDIWYFRYLHFLQEPKPKSASSKQTKIVGKTAKATNGATTTPASTTLASTTSTTLASTAAATAPAETNPEANISNTVEDAHKRKSEAVADNANDNDDEPRLKSAKLDDDIKATATNVDGNVKQVESNEELVTETAPVFFNDNEILLPDFILKTEPEEPAPADMENEDHESDEVLSDIGATSTYNSDRANSDRVERQPNFDLMERNNFDRYDHMTLAWAGILRNLPRSQQIFAEKLINDVMFEAQLENLSRESMLVATQESQKSSKHKNNYLG